MAETWYSRSMALASVDPQVLRLINEMRTKGYSWMQVFCSLVSYDLRSGDFRTAHQALGGTNES